MKLSNGHVIYHVIPRPSLPIGSMGSMGSIDLSSLLCRGTGLVGGAQGALGLFDLAAQLLDGALVLGHVLRRSRTKGRGEGLWGKGG